MKQLMVCWLLFLLGACSGDWELSGQLDELPPIFPDYKEVTVPLNIAPLNFSMRPEVKRFYALFRCGEREFRVDSDGGKLHIPMNKWKAILSAAAGVSLQVTVVKEDQGKWISYAPFSIQVSDKPIDPYIVYRLIEPGYSLWNKMGIYQRDLESFDEVPVYENKTTGYNCVNCHSFCMQDPQRLLFHLRAKMGGTVLIDGDKVEFLDTKTSQTLSAFTYPFWHPSGRYVAFSINKTTQQLHPTQRTEVYDTASDVIVYDIEKRAVLSTPETISTTDFETFPSFSPDGRSLFYCTVPACPMPDSIGKLSYSLCRISFDPASGTFGSQVDTLYNARINGKSVSFPRISPDGRFLLCTLSGYGTFPIWHKDADLYMVDLQTGAGSYPEAANSDDTESYHSWSSNSRWIVFSSRRLDGLYTRPFIAYVDENGKVAKPFLLPQKDTEYYSTLMKSYNIPEFVTGKVRNRSSLIRQLAEQGGQPVHFIHP